MAKKEEPASEVMDIGPKLAMDWLSSVPEYQRKVHETQVNKLAMAITRGEWRVNGAAIVFNEKGDLIDGQHRLHAIVKSGKTVQSLVVTGIAKDDITFASLGDTLPRRAQDFLHVPNVTVVASVLRTLWFMENKLLLHSLKGKGRSKTGAAKGLPTNPPVAEIVRLSKKHNPQALSELVEPLHEAMRMTKTGSWCVFLMYYFKTFRPPEEAAKVATFFARVGDGADLPADSPMLILRKKCLEGGIGNLVIPRFIMQAFVLKALNFHLVGQRIDRLSFAQDRESFPPLRGYDKSETPGKEDTVK